GVAGGSLEDEALARRRRVRALEDVEENGRLEPVAPREEAPRADGVLVGQRRVCVRLRLVVAQSPQREDRVSAALRGERDGSVDVVEIVEPCEHPFLVERQSHDSRLPVADDLGGVRRLYL